MDLYVDELKKVSEGKEIQVHISFVFTVVNFGLSCFTFYVIKWQMYFCCCFRCRLPGVSVTTGYSATVKVSSQMQTQSFLYEREVGCFSASILPVCSRPPGVDALAPRYGSFALQLPKSASQRNHRDTKMMVSERAKNRRHGQSKRDASRQCPQRRDRKYRVLARTCLVLSPADPSAFVPPSRRDLYIGTACHKQRALEWKACAVDVGSRLMAVLRQQRANQTLVKRVISRS